jgi:hypothetical protein
MVDDRWMAKPTLQRHLAALEPSAARAGLNRSRWAERAGLRAETLSRLFSRDDCDLRTLDRLAFAAGQRFVVVPEPRRDMPARWARDVEREYALLCASGSTDVRRWLRQGPRYFMAGLAVMMASARGADREAYLALAGGLCPALLEPDEFQRWLSLTPARPSRFLPMVRALEAVAA